MSDLISVKQLPIIEEKLQTISGDIKQKVDSVLCLAVTEDNYKEIKKYRAELKKQYNELETSRKAVKKAVLEPYNRFEQIYKKYVTDIFEPADKEISKKTKDIEDGLKQEKREAAESFFNEYALSFGIDFLTFDQMHVDITMSISLKKLRDLSTNFVSKVYDDLELIKEQANSEEILIEYKKTLNVSKAITSVTERHRLIEQEKAKAEAEKIRQEKRAEAELKVDNAISEFLDQPIEQTIVQPDEKIYSSIFNAFGTIEQLRKLKLFMQKEGIRYEQL